MVKKIIPKNETPEEKVKRETIETIAVNIASLAKAVNALLSGQLKRKAIVLLLASSSGQNQGTVDRVLSALQNLESDWLNKK